MANHLALLRERAPAVRYVAYVAAFLLGTSEPVGAEPAHFWLSTSNTESAGPDAPTITGVNGGTRHMHVWAQPATVADGSYDATTNPFKKLENFSLNVIASSSLVEFLDNSIVVHNPVIDANIRRFEFVHDFSQGLVSSPNAPDQIQGMQGFIITGGSGFTGFGPACLANDALCVATANGSPAWLVASLAFRTMADTGSTGFHLQIGSNGINHAGASSSQTPVVFGNEVGGLEPVYNAAANRNTTLAGDDFDLVVNATPSLGGGDYNGNGIVDAADFVVWRKTLGQNVPPGSAADGNNSGVIDVGDYTLWRSRFGRSAGSGSARALDAQLADAVPEPATLIMLISGILSLGGRPFATRRPSL